MKNVIGFLLTLLLLVSCGRVGEKEYHLEGAWTLTHLSYPDDYEVDYPNNGVTFFQIYDADSTLYSCQLFYTGSGIVVAPIQTIPISFIRMGKNEQIYLEDGDPHPLVIKSDSIVTIQRSGRIYTWKRVTDMSDEKIAEIRDIIKNDQYIDANEAVRHYILSTTERKLLSANHRLLYALFAALFCLLIIVPITIAKHQSAKRVQMRLRQIEEETQMRPQPVRQAMKEVETAFFASDYYCKLRRSIQSGQRLQPSDWDELSRQLNAVYPSFTNHLLSLYPMSDLELHTSLLIKLRIAPSDIANVLLRDISTISTVRSRLYQKVFNRKGNSRQWDEFVLSVGS